MVKNLLINKPNDTALTVNLIVLLAQLQYVVNFSFSILCHMFMKPATQVSQDAAVCIKYILSTKIMQSTPVLITMIHH